MSLMIIKAITEVQTNRFKEYLLENEKSAATVKKYLHEIRKLSEFLAGCKLDKLLLLKYRDQLRVKNKARTVNVKNSAINAYLEFIGMNECKLKYLKVQRRAFIDQGRELNEKEYKKLLEAARASRNDRLYYVMMTLCSTGMRVSELRYITVDSVKAGYVEISLKGKIRTVLIHRDLRKRLMKYAKSYGITSGFIFCTRSGKPLDRSNICHEMKKLCERAGVNPRKVFPHNLRHLFARTFYSIEKNIAHLADVMGHSSVETTRIYVSASVKEHERILNRMNLLV